MDRLEAIAQTSGVPEICVAVLDGPIDHTHPCFDGANLTTVSAGIVAEDCAAEPSGHGTHVASVIFGQPGSPVLGVAPGCRGIVVPIFLSGADGAVSNCSQLDLARAILVAVENGAHVINISGGQLSRSGEPEPLLANAIATCAARNILIVAAAGNDGCDCLHVPAACEAVLPVGGMDTAWTPMPSSNWGEAYRGNGILAPGQAVRGAIPGGGVAEKTGTSFATPTVAGVAALLLSMQVRLGQTPDPHAVKLALLKSALPCTPEDGLDCRKYLAGRLNVAGAVTLTLSGGPHMTELALPEHEIQASAEAAPEPRAFTPPPAPPTPARPMIRPSDMRAAPGQPLGRGEIAPSDCGCGGGAKAEGDCGCGGAAGTKKVQLVYALGTIGYDFESEARRDSIAQAMDEGTSPLIPEQLLAYLEANPAEAQAITWILNLDATPIYAIQPAGPFAAQGYERLRESLRAQIAEGVEIVSVPGYIAGSTQLLSGQTVPVIIPAVRGMFDWSIDVLVSQVLGERPAAEKEGGRRRRKAPAEGGPPSDRDNQASGLADFLARIYYDLRNLGLTGEERALNFAATNAVQVAAIVESATSQELDLDTISVHVSPVCRPGSECYDVEISFFNPENMNVANRIFRFTVDVSDVIPVSIGVPRSWTKRH